MADYMQGLPSTRLAKAVTGNTNPTPVDLAALAERLEAEASWRTDISPVKADLRLAARCVRSIDAMRDAINHAIQWEDISHRKGTNDVCFSLCLRCRLEAARAALAAVEEAQP